MIEMIEKAGWVLWPLWVLSVLALGVIFERIWFWISILSREQSILKRVLDAGSRNWQATREIAFQSRRQPIGRYLSAPLRLPQPDPEVFRLALETSADDELASMQRGHRLLEAIITLAPLLGLLGTVLGLIKALGSINISDLGTASTAGVNSGIGEALISTAAGLIVAIVSFIFYRIFQALWYNQVKIFRKAGNELELLYRQYLLRGGKDSESFYSEEVETEQPGDTETEQPGDTDTEQLGNPDTEQPGNPDTEQSGNPDTEQSGNPDTEQSGNPNTEQPENPDIEQSGNPDIEQSGNPDIEQPAQSNNYQVPEVKEK